MGPEAQPIDPEVSRLVLRKIDRFLMPAMVIGTSANPPSLLIPSYTHQLT